MSDEELGFSVRLEQQEDYQFLVKFDLEGAPDLLVDEPNPRVPMRYVCWQQR